MQTTESLVLYFRDPAPPSNEVFDDDTDTDPPDPAFERISRVARRFAESPEGIAIGPIHFVEIFLEHAHLYHQADETALTPAIVRNVVFEQIPRSVTMPPSEASRLVAELRMFFVFLAHELDSSKPFACAHALDGRADEQLAARLADPRRFGLLKAAVMAGLDEGYDVNTVEGLHAWFEKLAARDHAMERTFDDRARRARRKAQRRARKRNR